MMRLRRVAAFLNDRIPLSAPASVRLAWFTALSVVVHPARRTACEIHRRWKRKALPPLQLAALWPHRLPDAATVVR